MEVLLQLRLATVASSHTAPSPSQTFNRVPVTVSRAAGHSGGVTVTVSSTVTVLRQRQAQAGIGPVALAGPGRARRPEPQQPRR